jgi:hypothetical protein
MLSRDYSYLPTYPKEYRAFGVGATKSELCAPEVTERAGFELANCDLRRSQNCGRPDIELE